MPHRRSRRHAALILCGVLILLLLQGSVYPANGQSCDAGSETASATADSFTDRLRDFLVGKQAPSDTQVIVQKGDTLWEIAKQYNTTIDKLAEYNHISRPELIRVGQKILIPNVKQDMPRVEAQETSNTKNIPTIDILVSTVFGIFDWMDESERATAAVEESKPQLGGEVVEGRIRTLAVTQTQTQKIHSRSQDISKEDLELLARVIYAEARGENMEGQVAVGAVVLNRMESPQFPRTIRDVIYQPGAFTAVNDRQIHLTPDNNAYRAAEAALAGNDPTDGAVFYYNPKTATDRWIKSRPVVKRIGNHTFSI